MKIFRSHIAKLFLSLLIWSGMGLYLVRPVQAEAASSDFADWLQTVVKNDKTGTVQKQIYQLKESERSLESLIYRASEIVSLHNEDFNLPISAEDTDSDRVYTMLVMEWNSYQTGTGMGRASLPGTIKLSPHTTVEKSAYSFNGQTPPDHKPGSPLVFEGETVAGEPHAFQIKPLACGIAIGAP